MLATFLILIVLVGAVGILAYPMLSSFLPSRQAILVVQPGSSNQLKIAETWVDGNFTTDSGSSNLQGIKQVIYLPQAITTNNPSINNVGVVKYGVKTETFSFNNIATVFGYKVQALIYQVNITVQVVITQTDGSAVYKVNGPTSIVKGYSYDTEGQVQVPISGITDITSTLKSLSAPYGTYSVKITSIESWSLWVYNNVFGTGTGIAFPGLAQIVGCWVITALKHQDLCTPLILVQGPSTSVFTTKAPDVTYGEVNNPTFYMATPTSQITVGTMSGQTQVFELGFIPAGGFTGTVQVSFSGMPSGMSVNCQDAGCQTVTLPAPTVSYKVTVTSSTVIGNYTITATGTSGSIVRQGTFVVQVIQNGNNVQCPPVCNQANTVLAASITKTSFAPYDIVTVTGRLTVTNGAPVNGGEIDIKDQTSNSKLASAATGSDGKFTATFLAPSKAGDYAMVVSYPGDPAHTQSSTVLQYSVNQLAPVTLYIILAAVILVIVLLIGVAVSMTRKRSGP